MKDTVKREQQVTFLEMFLDSPRLSLIVKIWRLFSQQQFRVEKDKKKENKKFSIFSYLSCNSKPPFFQVHSIDW